MRRPSFLLRALFAVAILGAVLLWANCQLVFPADAPDGTPFFFGCYDGEITDPAGLGKVTLIIERSPAGERGALAGCMQSSPLGGEVVTFVGEVEEDNADRARFTAVRAAGGSFTFRVVRQPSSLEQATSVDFENINGSPFNLATGLPVCQNPVDCAQLTMAVPFLPDGGVL